MLLYVHVLMVSPPHLQCHVPSHAQSHTPARQPYNNRRSPEISTTYFMHREYTITQPVHAWRYSTVIMMFKKLNSLRGCYCTYMHHWYLHRISSVLLHSMPNPITLQRNPDTHSESPGSSTAMWRDHHHARSSPLIDGGGDHHAASSQPQRARSSLMHPPSTHPSRTHEPNRRRQLRCRLYRRGMFGR